MNSTLALPYIPNSARADRAVGALVSLVLIVGTAWIGQLTKGGPLVTAKPPASTALYLDMPPIPPDEPDVQDTHPDPAVVDLRPPMLADVPDLGTPNSITQTLEPPPPDMDIGPATITIPKEIRTPGNIGQIFDPSQLDRQPVPVSQARPNYPFEMRRDGIAGQVVVDFVVDSGGRAVRVFAANSTQRDFESAAVAAVAKWRFQPGRKAGRAVATHMQVPIVFTLQDSD